MRMKLIKQEVTELYEQTNEALYRYAYRYLGDPDAAEECVGAVFMRFLEHVNQAGMPNGNSHAYLFRIAHNYVVDHYRHHKLSQSLPQDVLPDPAPGVEEKYDRKQWLYKLRRALLKLPDEQRTVLELRFLEGWPHERVSKFLGKSVEATRAMQYRSLSTLRMTIDRIKR